MMRWVGMIGVAVLVLTAAAQAEDGYMTVHMDNQKIGSAVSAYWRSQAASVAAVSVAAVPIDPFMAIHMDNQKTGSAVSAYWRSVAQPVDLASADDLATRE